MSLMVLPTDVQIEIVDHLAVTSDQPMDDLHSLRMTCSSMHHSCGDPAIGQRLALVRFRHQRTWDDLINYYTLLARLTQVNNLEACFLIRIQIVFMEKHSPRPCLDDLAHAADGEHNLEAYLVILLLYRHNGDADDDETARRYIRRVKGEEESRSALAGDGSRPMSR
jgi:hypothetical protein